MGRWEGTLLRTQNLAFSVSWLTLLGADGAAGCRFSAWGGAVVGTLLGAFFGLDFGGALPRSVSDWCFGPPAETRRSETGGNGRCLVGRFGYLKGIRAALAGVESARVVPAKARQRHRDEAARKAAK